MTDCSGRPFPEMTAPDLQTMSTWCGTRSRSTAWLNASWKMKVKATGADPDLSPTALRVRDLLARI